MTEGWRNKSTDPPVPSLLAVPSSTVRVVVTMPGEKAFQVWPVTVGVQKFVVFETSGTPLREPAVTAYDSAGHVIGSLPRR
jgi:hypothetical protein